MLDVTQKKIWPTCKFPVRDRAIREVAGFRKRYNNGIDANSDLLSS